MASTAGAAMLTPSQPSPSFAGPIHLGPRGSLQTSAYFRTQAIQHSERACHCPLTLPAATLSPGERGTNHQPAQTVPVLS